MKNVFKAIVVLIELLVLVAALLGAMWLVKSGVSALLG